MSPLVHFLNRPPIPFFCWARRGACATIAPYARLFLARLFFVSGHQLVGIRDFELSSVPVMLRANRVNGPSVIRTASTLLHQGGLSSDSRTPQLTYCLERQGKAFR
jgi:hypothetical protein